jgi:NAD(P)-dependent dehydrogenase (short-subunit alcohol dehydrogenase family)
MATVDDLNTTSELVRRASHRALAARGDVGSLPNLADAIRAEMAEFGRIDLVSVNAVLVPRAGLGS